MRQRVDGNKFQEEFEKHFLKSCYVLRLPTLNTGYSGLTQPADFIVARGNVHFVEVKETGKDYFSITSMQQYVPMKEFTLVRKQLRLEMNYLVLVHFIKRGVYKLLTSEQALELSSNRKQLMYDSEIGSTYRSLDEIEENSL